MIELPNRHMHRNIFSSYSHRRDEVCTLWFDEHGRVAASVDNGRGRTWFSRDKIFNIYSPDSVCDDRLETCLRSDRQQRVSTNWVLLHSQGRVFIGPCLDGAAHKPGDKRIFTFPDDWERAKASTATKHNYRRELLDFFGDRSIGPDYPAHHWIAKAQEIQSLLVWRGITINVHAPHFLDFLHRSVHNNEFSRNHLADLKTFIVRNPNLTPATLCSYIIAEAREVGSHVGSFPGQYDLGNLPRGNAVKAEQAVRRDGFAEKAQATGLVKTYNACNPGRPLPQVGTASGQIGGVGLQPGLIEGLKDSMADLLECEHLFLLPTEDGRPPFSDTHLRQIIRELAANIFVHGRQPMFSLHFNQDGTMYPVIPPEYQDTLVGRVMGMLDYMMKGYLSGGMFTPAFLDGWRSEGADKTENSLDHLTDLRAYCRRNLGDGCEYVSLHEAMQMVGFDADGETDIHYRSSFRIIADNPVIRTGRAFQIGTGFRVEYTIDAPPELEAERQRHRRDHGTELPRFARMQEVYGAMADDIRERMPKLPLCREYFNLLGVVHFFSHYLPTLKVMGKVPALPRQPRAEKVSFPKLLPPLPIRKVTRPPKQVDLYDVLATLAAPDKKSLEAFVVRLVAEARPAGRAPTAERVQQRLRSELTPQVSQKLANGLHTCLERDLDGTSLLPRDGIARQPLSINAVGLLVASVVDAALAAGRTEASVSRRRRELFATFSKNQQVQRSVTGSISGVDQQVRKALADFDRQVSEALRAFDADALSKKPVHYGWPTEEMSSYLGRCRLFDYEVGRQRGQLQQDLAGQRQAEVRRLDALKQQQLKSLTRNEADNQVIINDQAAALSALTSAESEARRAATAPLRVSEQHLRLHRISAAVPQTVLFSHGEAPTEDGGEVRVDIVGGCGLELARQATRSLAGGASRAHAVARALAAAEPETLKVVAHEGRSSACFKLPVFDCPVETDDEYLWLLTTLEDAEAEGAGVRTLLRLAVMEGNLEVLDEALLAVPSSEAAAELAQPVAEDGTTLLHLACAPKAAGMVNRLLALGADPLAVNAAGLCPLHLAASTGDVDLVGALLADPRGAAQVRIAARDGSQPLHVAVRTGEMGVIRALTEAGSALTAVTSHGMTPLLSACHGGTADVALHLLNSGDNGTAALEDGRTALHLAAESGLVEVVVALVERGFAAAQTCKAGRTALHIAARAGQAEVVTALLSRPDPVAPDETPLVDLCNKAGATALLEAVRSGHLEVVRCLIAGQARLDTGPPACDPPLVAAIRSGRVEVSRVLIAAAGGPEILAEGTVFDLAASHGMTDALAALFRRYLESGHDARWRPRPAEGRTGIAHLLCRRGDTVDLERYVDSKWLAAEALAYADGRGRTPFEMAVKHAREAVVDLFERRVWPGVDWQPLGGRLEAAVRHGLVEITADELNAGAGDRCVGAQVGVSRTRPLAHLAAAHGKAACLRLLLRRGMPLDDADSESESGPCALQAAIESGDLATVDVVVRHTGTVPRTLPGDGRSPPEVAAMAGNAAMVRWLFDNGVPLLRAPLFGRVLTAAACGGHSQVVETILALPDAPVPPTASVREAAGGGHLEVLTALLRAGAPVDFNAGEESSPLAAAAEHGQLNAARMLLAAGAQLGGGGHGDPLQAAAEGGHESLLLELLNQSQALTSLERPDVRARLLRDALDKTMLRGLARLLELSTTPEDLNGLAAAADRSEAPLASVLLAEGPGALEDAEARLVSVLASQDEAEVLRALDVLHPAQQVVVHSEGQSMLWPVAFLLAQQSPTPKVAAWLRVRSAQVARARDAYGNTFAHIAARSGWAEMVDGREEARNLAGETPLMSASRSGRTGVVKDLLAAGAAVAATDGRGRTAFHAAAQEGEVAVIEVLVGGTVVADVAAAIDRCDQRGDTSLAVAASARQEASALSLLRHGADPNRGGCAGRRRALHSAAENGLAELTVALLAAGADPACRDDSGRTALHLAAAAAQLEPARLLLEAAPLGVTQVDQDGRTPLHLAAQAGSGELVNLLVDHMRAIDIDCRDSHNLTPLLAAATAGQPEVVFALWRAGGIPLANARHGRDAAALAAGAEAGELCDLLDAFATTRTPQQQLGALAGAALGNAPLAIARLAKSGVPLSLTLAHGCSALALACRAGSSRAVCALLRRGADASPRGADGFSALCAAISAGSLAVVKQLLRHDPELLRQPAPNGGPILVWSAEVASLPIVTCLLLMGADPAMVDIMGRAAVEVAEARERADVVDMLLAFGCDLGIGRAGRPGRYAAVRAALAGSGAGRLHIASLVGDEDGVAALLAIDKATEHDGGGRTPLHLAASAKVAELIVLAGGDIHARDALGKTPLLAAVEAGPGAGRLSGLVEGLIRLGARANERDAQGMTPIFAAFQANDLTTFDILRAAARRTIPCADGETMDMQGWKEALADAVAQGDIEGVAYLGGPIDANQLAIAIRRGGLSTWRAAFDCPQILRLLVEFFRLPIRRVNDGGQNLLHLAAITGHAEAARYLFGLDKALAAEADGAGYSPLLRAVESDRPAVAEVLCGDVERALETLRGDVRAASRNDNPVLWARGLNQHLSMSLPRFDLPASGPQPSRPHRGV